MVALHRDKKRVRHENTPRSRGKYCTLNPLLERSVAFLLAPSLVSKMVAMNSNFPLLAAVPIEYFSFLSTLIPAAYGPHSSFPKIKTRLAELSQRVLTLLSSHVSSERSASSSPDYILCGLLECLRSILSLSPEVDSRCSKLNSNIDNRF